MAIHRAEAVWDVAGNDPTAAELLASAVVAAFNETLGRLLEQAGFGARVRTQAVVVTESEFIYKIDLSVWASAPQLNQVALRRLTEQAKHECPLMRTLKTRFDLISVICTEIPSAPPVLLTPRPQGLIHAAKQG